MNIELNKSVFFFLSSTHALKTSMSFHIYTGNEEVRCDKCGVKGVEMLESESQIGTFRICANDECPIEYETIKEQIQIQTANLLRFLCEEIEIEAYLHGGWAEPAHKQSCLFWKNAEKIIIRGERLIDKKKIAASLKAILEVYAIFVDDFGFEFIWKNDCEKLVFMLEEECWVKPAK